MSEILQLVLLVVCICGAAFYSGIETGVISIRRLRLRHRLRQGDRAAQKLAFFLENPDRLLGTTLVGTNLCIVLASVISTRLAGQWMGVGGQVLAGVVIALFLLIFGEYVPKAWFRALPYHRSARFANVLYISWIIFNPIGRSITWLAGLLVKGHANGKRDLCSLATRDELKILTVEAEQNGVLSAEERVMIHRTVELADKTAGELQTPMGCAVVVDAGCQIAELIELAKKNNYMRYPVRRAGESGCEEVIDLFEVLTGSEDLTGAITPFVRKAVFISQSTPADDVMPMLRMTRQSMGFVTDDKDVVTGILTTDDILKQIVVQDLSVA